MGDNCQETGTFFGIVLTCLMSERKSMSAAPFKAEGVFTATQLRDEAVKSEISKERAKTDAKTAKLRALRLAKEAADKIAADKVALEAPPKKPVKKRVIKAG